MAKVLSTGSTKNNRDSPGKRRGFKIFIGSMAKAGAIILRQLGTVWHAGRGVKQGRDYTLNACISGKIIRYKKNGRNHISIA